MKTLLRSPPPSRGGNPGTETRTISWGGRSEYLTQKLDPVSSLLGAGAQYRQQDRLRQRPGLRPAPAPDLSVHHRQPGCQIRRPTGRFQSGYLEEGEDLVFVSREVFGKSLVGLVSSDPSQESVQPALQLPGRHRHPVRRHFLLVPAVPQMKAILKKRFDLPRKAHRAPDRHFQEVIAAPDEMSQTLLMSGFQKLVVRRPAIVDHGSRIVGPQDLRSDLEAAAWPDHISGGLCGHKRPEPLEKTGNLPAGFVRIDDRALAHHNQNRPVDIATALGRSQHDLGRTAPRKRHAKGVHEKARNLAMGKSQFLVQLDRQRLRLWPNLTGSGPQGIGGLQSMASLDPALATEAMADFDVEAAADGFSRDFDLELRLDLVQFELPAALGTGIRKRRLVDFVHLRRRLAVSLGAVVLARLPAAFLRIGFGRSLGEGGCLAFPATADLLEELAEFPVFLFEGFDPLLLPVDQLQELLVGRFSAFFAHQPWLSAGPVKNFSPNPLNNYQ